jgi:ribulose-phosphate 3-epimerase
MRATVVPAVNTRSVVVARREFALAFRMGREVQIDCADGQFVRHRTLGPNALVRLKPSGSVELHLMVREPHRWLPAAIAIKARRIAFHVESVPDPRPLIAALRVHRISPVAAANPRTPISRLTALIQMVDGLLLLGVSPGPSGGRFHPATLRRVRTLRRLFPRTEIGVDGGLSVRNISAVAAAGASRLVVGSSIFNTKHPLASFRELRAALP